MEKILNQIDSNFDNKKAAHYENALGMVWIQKNEIKRNVFLIYHV